MDSEVTKNYILLETVKRLKVLYRLKENPYLLVIILENPIFYKNRVMYIKTELVNLRIKR